MLTAMVLRAFGGSIARKLRAVLPDLALKGEKEVVIEVRNRVIIAAVAGSWRGGRGLEEIVSCGLMYCGADL